MHTRKIPEDLSCGIVISMKVLGAKWKPCIIDAINNGYKRPSEMHRQLSDATPRVIDMQLKELEMVGVVKKTLRSGFPLHTEYDLTNLGKSLLPIIESINRWGIENKSIVEKELAV